MLGNWIVRESWMQQRAGGEQGSIWVSVRMLCVSVFFGTLHSAVGSSGDWCPSFLSASEENWCARLNLSQGQHCSPWLSPHQTNTSLFWINFSSYLYKVTSQEYRHFGKQQCLSFHTSFDINRVRLYNYMFTEPHTRCFIKGSHGSVFLSSSAGQTDSSEYTRVKTADIRSLTDFSLSWRSLWKSPSFPSSFPCLTL